MVIIFFFFGLLIGSFLNVCIYRLPQGKSIVSPPSRCPKCRARLRLWDLIPVLSWVWLQGKCRYCHASVAARYALVELLTGVLFLWAFSVVGLSLELIKALIFISFLIIITFIDIDHQLILDKVLLVMAGAGVVINLFIGAPMPDLVSMLLAAAAGGGVLLVIAVLTRGGMGGGDIKLMAVLGLWLGWPHIIIVMFGSFIIGGIAGVLLMLLKLKGRRDYIPFGPFIALAAFLTMLYGLDILLWYFKRFL
ncbi:MAG: prepilin peptidase [Negativicutes bacterium]|nr:prepilin peptidase [Negativicutes bacterium]